MEYWKGKVAVVTGASSGIGAEVLVGLAKVGMHVVGLARRKKRIEELAASNKNITGKIYALECDISNLDSIKKSFKWIESNLKVVHILINNAGRLKYGEFFDQKFPFEEIKSTVDINFIGLSACTREAHRLMQKHTDNCYIINVNSVAGHMTPTSVFKWGNVYGATKHALRQMTHAMRLELNSAGNRRIRVTNVSPGGVDTEFSNAAGVPKEFYEAFKDSPRLSGKDVSDQILYLVSTPPHVNISELTVQATGEGF